MTTVEGGLRRLRARFRVRPPIGFVRFGSLRRRRPISDDWGFDRGRPIDRTFIAAFLGRHAGDIRGSVLEVAGNGYTRRFGTAVTLSDVIDRRSDNSNATIVADLARAPEIADSTYDCVIVTQTLQYIYDIRAAVGTLHRVLAPGGVALVTVPGITRISTFDASETGEYWHFTTWSARALFEERFPKGSVEVASFGDVLTATAALHGLAAEDLRRRDLEHRDPTYQVLVTVRAVKEFP
jgi:SAM-dependent methyltransferase